MMSVHHVTGTTETHTITVPPMIATMVGASEPPPLLEWTAICDAAWSVGTSGNIARAATFVAGQRITFTYDPNEEVWFL